MPNSEQSPKPIVKLDRDNKVWKSHLVDFLHSLFFPKTQLSESDYKSLTIEKLRQAIAPAWEKDIVPILIKLFGKTATLYAIFYASDTYKNEVILEIWDSQCFDSKPSQVFSFNGIPDIDNQFLTTRCKAEVMTLDNWCVIK